MRQLAILLALQLLLPAVFLFKIQLFVDQHSVSDKSQADVSSQSTIQCSASRTTFSDYQFLDSSLYLRLQHVTQRANTRDTYENLVSLPLLEKEQWDLIVALTGIEDLTTLRCDLSSSVDPTSYTLLVSTYVTLYPNDFLTPPPLPYYTDAFIQLGTGTTTTTPSPTASFQFGTTYMVYALVILIFLATLTITGAVSCWLSIRVRNNRFRLQRAQAERIRELQEAISSAQEPILLTQMQLSRSENAPPPYEGAPVSTTLSMRIDSAPPCYQEALAQPPSATQDKTATSAEAPPAFESLTSYSSTDSSTDDTTRLIGHATEV